MLNKNRLASIAAVAGLAAIGIMAMPHDAKAWWHQGVGFGFIFPPVVVAPPPVYVGPAYAPPYYAPPPVAYAPPPGRVWVPPHWQGSYWVQGHWS